MAATGHFTPGIFKFLVDLADNNNREWFADNKSRYESDVKEPILNFIADFDERIESISPHLVADTRSNGGSMFRIYRDTRFAKDKTPYKINAGMQFRHEAGKDAHAPGLYLHVEPGSAFGGGGIWRPDSKTLGKIRQFIIDNDDEWIETKTDAGVLERHTLEGDSLKRPPRGFDPDHPLIDDLKKKDHFAVGKYTEAEVISPDFIDQWTEDCMNVSSYIGFLTRAVGLPF